MASLEYHYPATKRSIIHSTAYLVNVNMQIRILTMDISQHISQKKFRFVWEYSLFYSNRTNKRNKSERDFFSFIIRLLKRIWMTAYKFIFISLVCFRYDFCLNFIKLKNFFSSFFNKSSLKSCFKQITMRAAYENIKWVL